MEFAGGLEVEEVVRDCPFCVLLLGREKGSELQIYTPQPDGQIAVS